VLSPAAFHAHTPTAVAATATDATTMAMKRTGRRGDMPPE
jgi:hypothetical protein